MECIKWTTLSESIHIIGEFWNVCDSDVRMNFHQDQNGDLMVVSNYIVVINGDCLN